MSYKEREGERERDQGEKKAESDRKYKLLDASLKPYNECIT